MSHLHSIRVSIRRVLARRPWLYAVAVALAAGGIAMTVHGEMRAVDTARSSWGETQTVLVATETIEPGASLQGETRQVPSAISPPGAINDATGLIARQHIGVGEIVTRADVAQGTGPMALVPDDWLAVPVVESTPSGAAVGERVEVVSEGVVITPDALVVGHVGDATLVGVERGVAAMVAVGAGQSEVTLLRVP